MITSDQKAWLRRLVIAVVLVTCAGAGVFVLVTRSPDDCAVVSDMMTKYASSQVAANSMRHQGHVQWKDLLAAADAEAATATELRTEAGTIASPQLRGAGIRLADGARMLADLKLDELYRPAYEEDPVTAALAPPDPAVAKADDTFFSAVRALMAACPSAQRPGQAGQP
ncbi:MAG: hypothetical protein JWR37_5197 [Mycobacterium sp.]|jgi:hypothetical protein|nr:hypothetical protein [Mycobacterium sp.]